MSLKELTANQHRNAERQLFASVLMSGEIENKIYLRYLFNQYACYNALENHNKFLLPHDDLKRATSIMEDIVELNIDYNYKSEDMLTKSTFDYVNHVVHNIKTENDFIAHVYVRYLGDLRGGQMIAKKIPGQGKYYDFKNQKILADAIYSKLNDSMADEAKIVFDFATQLFIEMHDVMQDDE
tara:strand:- start:976 stop:1521 length:546 start_codon:yes stop_codon:yes gene_type:complete